MYQFPSLLGGNNLPQSTMYKIYDCNNGLPHVNNYVTPIAENEFAVPQLSIHQFNNILNVCVQIYKPIMHYKFHGNAVREILIYYSDIRCNLSINNEDRKRTVDAPCVKTHILFHRHTLLRREARSVVTTLRVSNRSLELLRFSSNCHALSCVIAQGTERTHGTEKRTRNIHTSIVA